MKASKLALAALLAATAAPLAHAAPSPIAAAVADPGRPAADTARDADRKPAELMAFAGIKPGMTVVDMFPGGGYFTRLFSTAVGPKGIVYAYAPDEMLARAPKSLDAVIAIAAEPGHANVKPTHDPLMAPPPQNAFADVVWTSQNYHDVHNMKGVDLVAFNKLVYQGLKPGGVYIVTDHAAAAGSGAAATATLHRVDPALVRSEVEAAGFTFDGESKILVNPADDHTLKVFDPTLHDRSDKFVYRFRKPK